MARRRKSLWKGAVAGLAGGLVASWVMTEAQTGMEAIAKKLQQNGKSSSPDSEQKKNEQSEGSEDATVKTAKRLSHTFLHRSLNSSEKEKAGPIVHYAFGTLIGGIYGATAEKVPQIKSGYGLPFGAAIFVGADEIAVPALGLSPKSFSETEPQEHAYALLSHFVYGATAEIVRRGVRAWL
jgi:putative membrane protein